MQRRAFLRLAVVPALLLGGATGCLTESATGPAQTTPGTVTASINGATWTANSDIGLGTAIGQISTTGREVLVAGLEVSSAGIARQIILRVNTFNGIGTYPLARAGSDELTGPSYANFLVASIPQNRITEEYDTTAEGAGTVTVSAWDATTRRIEGTFTFTGVASTPDSTVRVTDGRFEGRLTGGN